MDLWSWGNTSITNYNALDLYNDRISWYNYGNDPDDYYINLVTDIWYSLAISYDGLYINYYLNGNKVLAANTSSLSAFSVDPNTTLSIGRDIGRNTSYFNGKIRDFRIYNK